MEGTQSARSSNCLRAGLLAALCWWLALPPVCWWPLAWVAAVPLAWLTLVPRLAGTHPYRQLWLAGFLFWLATTYWLTLPYWATGIGWLILSAFLALVFPTVVALVRVARRHSVPMLLALPSVWIGLEWLQSHLFCGFPMGLIGHSQFRLLPIIQCSDLQGAYAVSGLVVFVGGCLAASGQPSLSRRARAVPLLLAVGAIATAWAYGSYRLGTLEIEPGPKVALIQGSIDVDMKSDPRRGEDTYRQYLSLSEQAIREQPEVELVVWPETMVPFPWIIENRNESAPELAAAEQRATEAFGRLARHLDRDLLLGVDAYRLSESQPIERRNAALLLDRTGQAKARYDKCHRVMFGEYLPLGDWFPSLYQLSPMGPGLTPGEGPVPMRWNDAWLLPSICYESTIPHLIWNQYQSLHDQMAEAGHATSRQMLVNLTNDGWFWGSSELDLHLICGVFRAVEVHRPLLIAANTGFSAVIDPRGQIVAQGPRRQTGVVTAAVPFNRSERGMNPLLRVPLAGGAFAFSVMIALIGIREARQARIIG